MAVLKKIRQIRRSAEGGDDDDSAELEQMQLEAARAAALEQAKNADRKAVRSANVADEMNAAPKSEFVGMEHPEIGDMAPKQETPEEESGDGSEEEPEQPGAQPAGPEGKDQTAQQQAQRQSYLARLLNVQRQTLVRQMRPIEQKIKTEQKEIDEINGTIKKNDSKIASSKTIQRLGCCVLIIPGLGWIVGIIIRILTTKSKIEARKAEAENWAKKGKLAEAKRKIEKLKKQRQKLARQAGTK